MSFKETINENDEKNSCRSHHILLKNNQSKKEESKIQKKTYEQANEKTVVHLDSEYQNGVSTPNGGWKLNEKVHGNDLSSSKKPLEFLNSGKETQTIPSNLSTKNDFDKKELDIPRATFQKSSPVAKTMKKTEEILFKKTQESLPKKELSSPTATCEKQTINVEERTKHNRPSLEIVQQHCEHRDIGNKEKPNKDIPDEKLAKEPGIQIEIKHEQATSNSQKNEKTINQYCSPKKEVTTPLKENESPSVYAALKVNSEPQVKVKPWMPPFDVDPMSQTFLRMPFTYQSLQVQCSQDSNRPHIKRPMNAFMVWAKQNRATIAKRFPNASNAEISVRLGHIWNQLPNDEQKPYFEEANNLKEKHKHENPNWVYQPRPGRKCRKALFSSTGSQSLPTSPVIRRTAIEKYRERPIQPRSLPNSPIAKRSLWSAENLKTQKGELSEEELQSRIVQELLEQEEEEERMKSKNEGTGNPTMDRYIDEWLSPKRTRKDARDACLMNDAMLPAALSDDDQEMLEQETECDGKDFAKYIKQLKTVDEENFTKLESTICSLEEEDEMSVEKMSVVAQG